MIPYEFSDSVTIDLAGLKAVDEIRFANASINDHSDWTSGEHFYELIFQFTPHKLRRYAHYDNEKELIAERKELIDQWKNQ